MSIGVIILLLIVIIALLCVGAYFFGTIKNNNGNDKWRMEQRWKKQEEEDKRILENDPALKHKIWFAYESLVMMKEGIESGRNRCDINKNAELCLRGLTPTLFLEHYDIFKTKDVNKIKDSIYKERIYFSHDLMIFFATYIFENNKNIDMLNLIKKSKDESFCSKADKEMAEQILLNEKEM